MSIVYLTRGEAGIRNGHGSLTSQIRTAEAQRGSILLWAQAYFADQIDGKTSTDYTASRAFTQLLASLDPDVVFAHWPLDGTGTIATLRNSPTKPGRRWASRLRSPITK